jgi:transposase InsO family protein
VSHCCIWRKLHHAERLVTELEKDFATAGGPPMVLRMDNGPELVSQALQRFCGDRIGMSYIPPGTPWNNGYIESFNNRLRKECLNRNHWNTLFGVRGHRRLQAGAQPPTPAFGRGLANTSRVRGPMQPHHYPVACEIN